MKFNITVYQHFGLFERPKFSRNLKKSKFENFHIFKKSAITFAQGSTGLSLELGYELEIVCVDVIGFT